MSDSRRWSIERSRWAFASRKRRRSSNGFVVPRTIWIGGAPDTGSASRAPPGGTLVDQGQHRPPDGPRGPVGPAPATTSTRGPVLAAADLENRKTHEARHNDRRRFGSAEDFVRRKNSASCARLDVWMARRSRGVGKHPRLQQDMSVVDLCFFVAEHDNHICRRSGDLEGVSRFPGCRSTCSTHRRAASGAARIRRRDAREAVAGEVVAERDHRASRRLGVEQPSAVRSARCSRTIWCSADTSRRTGSPFRTTRMRRGRAGDALGEASTVIWPGSWYRCPSRRGPPSPAPQSALLAWQPVEEHMPASLDYLMERLRRSPPSPPAAHLGHHPGKFQNPPLAVAQTAVQGRRKLTR